MLSSSAAESSFLNELSKLPQDGRFFTNFVNITKFGTFPTNFAINVTTSDLTNVFSAKALILFGVLVVPVSLWLIYLLLLSHHPRPYSDNHMERKLSLLLMYMNNLGSKVENGIFDFLEAVTDPHSDSAYQVTDYVYHLPDLEYAAQSPQTQYYPEPYKPQEEIPQEETPYPQDTETYPVNQDFSKSVERDNRQHEDYMSGMVSNYVADMGWDNESQNVPQSQRHDWSTKYYVDKQDLSSDMFGTPFTHYYANTPHENRSHIRKTSGDDSIRPSPQDNYIQ